MMKAPAFFGSRWFRGALLALLLPVLLGATYLAVRLGTTHSAMYAEGIVDGESCTVDDPEAETLVYTSLRPANWDIYLFSDLAAAPRRLTSHPALDYNAVLSPDGRWVVFVSERSGSPSLYALDLEAEGEPLPLTSDAAMDDAPSFSPDGSSLAFVSTRDGSPDIFVMPFRPGDPGADSRAVNLTRSPYGDFNPAFSPDGTKIAFSSNRGVFHRLNPIRLISGTEAMTEIFVMNADGTRPRRVFRALGVSGSPAWTETGAGLLHYRMTHPSNAAIHRSPVRGKGADRMSPTGLSAFTPTAGPDGSVIFVALDGAPPPPGRPALQPHGGSLYQVAADGSRLTRIGDPDGAYLRPHFQPATGQLVAHGDGPVPAESMMPNGTPFTWPGAVRTVQLPDRCLRLHATRSYFPSVDDRADRIVSIQWVHETNSYPPGPSPIVSAELGGVGMDSIFPAADDGFMWTPVVTRDGKWIFFTKGGRFAPADENVDIWKVRRDGTGAVNLTADSDANDAFPDISADGRRVVFRSGRHGGSGRGGNEIYLMDAEGGQLRRITHDGANATMPAISPDGRTVVYTSTRGGRGMKLWIQSLEDPEDRGRLLEPDRARLTGLDMHPRFSPDGRWIVFTSDRAGFRDEFAMSGGFPQPYGTLFAVPVDGSGPSIRLTDDKWEDGLPFWGGPPARLSERN